MARPGPNRSAFPAGPRTATPREGQAASPGKRATARILEARHIRRRQFTRLPVYLRYSNHQAKAAGLGPMAVASRDAPRVRDR